MDEIVTAAEIEARFKSEWILLEDPQTDRTLQIKGGKLRWHSKDRDEVYRKAKELKPKRFAVLFTGKMPKNTAVAL